MLGLAGVAFLLWEWQPKQKRSKNDAQNLAQDWQAVGGDIRAGMYRYEQKGR